jgi:short-subunit dehydrogenase
VQRPLALVTGASSGIGPNWPAWRLMTAMTSAASVAAAGWRGLAAGKPVVVPDIFTQNELQTIRVLPWQVIARASQSRNR